MKEVIKKIINNTIFEITILSLIIINLFIFILQTDVYINAKFYVIFSKIEIFSIIIFTLEYLLRLVTISKIKDIFNLYMVIDLLAILPFYLSFIPINTIFLRGLRLFRIFRIAKITRYTNAIENIKTAFAKRKNELIITGFIFTIAVLISSTLIYYAEHNTGNDAFRSIITSIWWSVVTFTTVGYGDSYPITSLGKCIAGISAVFGVGLHGLLIGVISSSIIEVINKGVKHGQD